MAEWAGIAISELVDVTGQCSGPDGILFASYDGDGDPPSDRCRCNRRRRRVRRHGGVFLEGAAP
jgi:hypothetical protein